MSDAAKWNLNHLQVGKFAEYFTKMSFVRCGIDVYTSEVDERAIDFVARKQKPGEPPRYFDVQVKALLKGSYTFVTQEKVEAIGGLRDNFLVALALFDQDKDGDPDLYLIKSSAWATPTELLVRRDYGKEGQKSKPEWGISVSKGSRDLLPDFKFSKVVASL